MATCTDPDCLVTRAGIGAHNEHPAPVKISGDNDMASVIKMPAERTYKVQRALNFEDSKRRLLESQGKTAPEDPFTGDASRQAALEHGIAEGTVIPMDIGRAKLRLKRMEQRNNG